MRYILISGLLASLFLVVAPGHAHAQNIRSNTSPDTTLVRQLGADQYGMRVYTLVLLKTGPVRDQDEKTVMQLQKEHLAYLYSLLAQQKLVALGPLLAESDIQGICIYNTVTEEEARSLAEMDPMVKSGRLVVEAYPWYSSAALLEVPGIHKTIETRPFYKIME